MTRSARPFSRLSHLREPVLAFANDAVFFENLLMTDNSQPVRRAYVRSCLAMIEGTVWVFKQTCLNGLLSQRRLSASKYIILSEKNYTLDGSGKIKEEAKHISITNNIKYTFALLSELLGRKFDLGVGTKGWECFIASNKIRNRMMHPKNADEYEVSDADLKKCEEASSWFNILVSEVFTHIASDAEISRGSNADRTTVDYRHTLSND